MHKYSGVNLVGSGHVVTCIIWYDHICSGAIIARCPQAQNLPWHQIRAIPIDRGIQNRKLIATEGSEDARMVRLRTHVETFWAADITSQNSPGSTVWVRVHD
jgi:hypothetical protein